MKIAQIVPGSGGGFYCENCLRDAALAKALIKRCSDMLLLPMYLPGESDLEALLADKSIFFGGVNVYLQQRFSLFRRTPRWVDRLFDRPKLLRWVSRLSSMTGAGQLGEATVSMLEGSEGRQKKELARLVHWLERPENRPDIVCLSNLLLAGLAGPLKDATGASVVSMLQDEDSFLDGLAAPYRQQAWRAISEKAADIDAFISVSNYYAMEMRRRLVLDNVHVVYPGIDPGCYQPRQLPPRVPTIGFLSRMCREKGIDTLVEAFIKLKTTDQLRGLRMRLAGGQAAKDKKLLNKLRGRLENRGFGGDVEFLPNPDRQARKEFLGTLTLLAVPEKRPVALGFYVLEAFAAGVPVVEPAFAPFTEIIEASGGGVLFEPGSSDALAVAMRPLLLDGDYSRNIGAEGRKAACTKFNISQTAEEVLRIFSEALALNRKKGQACSKS